MGDSIRRVIQVGELCRKTGKTPHILVILPSTPPFIEDFPAILDDAREYLAQFVPP